MIPSCIRMLTSVQVLRHTTERCRVIRAAVVSELVTRKEQALPVCRIVGTDGEGVVDIVNWTDYQMKRIDRVAAAAFASRAGGSETTVIIEVLTRLVGRDNDLRMLGPNERIVLTN